MIKKLATIAIILLLGIYASSGQNMDANIPSKRYLQSEIQEREFDREQWANMIEGVDFKEKLQQQKPREQDTNQGEDVDIDSFLSVGVAIARFLLIVLGAILIAMLLRAMIGYKRVKNKRIKRDPEEGISIEQIEEHIHEADLDHFIQQAKKDGNYNLAIRLYYLAILKELSFQKAIKWKVDKTNREYLHEMQGRSDYAEFRDLTVIFERTWYGDRPLNSASFDQLEPRFRLLIDQLSPVPETVTTT